ncbi:bifunctional 4-hydroxy-2-oxoglutarate aldolase/2-dehydro-3-deoxy-phosphogluconate aldolase [Sinomicrobium sp.]
MEKKTKADFNWSFFEELPVIGILRGVAVDDIAHILPLCLAEGLRTIEVTLNTEDVERSVNYATNHFGDKLNIGVGTVCCREDLEKALSYGASFIVTPNLDEEVVRECVKIGVPVFCGAFTPTEIYRAWKLGAFMVKVFPADNLGAKYFSNIIAPFDNIKLLPTGGINAANVRDYLNSGASGVGVSGGIFSKEIIDKKDWKALEKRLKTFVSCIS